MDRRMVGPDGKVALVEMSTGKTIRRYPVDATELIRNRPGGEPAEYRFADEAGTPEPKLVAAKAAIDAATGGTDESKDDGPTVPELRKTAQDLGIEGAAQMNRAELTAAIADAGAPSKTAKGPTKPTKKPK